MTGLEITGLTKHFGSHLVLDDVSIHIEAGAILAVLGPSGGGKTTLLRIIAGFLDADAGSVSFGGRGLVTAGRGIPPQRRGVGYVPQEGALFPHLDVAANIAFGIRGAARREFDVDTLLALVDLPATLRRRFPHELSGGQQQRVALARALAPRPDIVLLDEPFSSLDAGLRLETGQAVAQAIRAAGATAVLVTHDQGEALALADQVAVLQDGRVAQVAAPADLYRSPATPAVAAFVGAVVALDAEVTGDVASCALGNAAVVPGGPQGPCRILIRPEHLALSADRAAGTPARVVGVSYFGHDATVDLVLVDQEIPLQARVSGDAVPAIDDLLSVSIGGPVTVVGRAVMNPLSDLRRWGARPALITADDTLTYAELADRAESMLWPAEEGRRLVLVPGANTLQTLVAYVSAIANGHVVLLVPGDGPAGTDALIEAYDPDVVFDPPAGGFVARHEGSHHELHPDLALLMTTSGSTGSPKLVRLSYDNVRSNAAAIADYLGLTPDDRAITTLPMHYCYGLSVINSHLIAGAGIVVTDWSVLDPCLWELADRARVTSFAGVPYTFDLLDSSGFAQRKLPSLRYVTQAGGRLDPSRVAGYARLGRERGWDFFAMYGQTEATARMAYLPPELADSHPHALGVPVPGGSFRIDPVADEQRPGVGELVYRGDNVMLGYATSAADLARGRDVEELRTGDLVRRDDDGLLEWVGRRSRFAKAYGVRIDLDDLEAVVARHGGAARCVSTGDRLHAFIAWHDDARALQPLVARAAGLPGHAVTVTRLREMPRNASGKTDYPALERHAEMTDEPGDARSRRGHPVTIDQVRDLYSVLLGRPDAKPDDSFTGLGGDSLSYVELSVRLSELRLELPHDWHTRPIHELVAAPERRRGRGVRLEMSIVLRAVAIMLVLGTHANLFGVPGGAHLLLAVCGYNFVRFQLAAESPRARARSGLRSLAHLVVPSVIWIGAVAVVLRTYDLSTVLMLNGVFGSDSWTVQWQFWFLEAIVWSQVGALALLSVPMVHRAWRRSPYGFALAFTLAALATRYALVGIEAGPTERYTPSIVMWCFALGWLVATARTAPQRLIASVLAVAGVAGFFGDPQREAIVAGGLLLLVWVPAVPAPRIVARGVGSLAAASLYIYLTHWQVYPHLEMKVPILAVLSSVVVGLAYRQVAVAVAARLTAIRRVPLVRRAPSRRSLAVLEPV